MEEKSSNFIHDIIDEDLLKNPELKIHTRFPPEPNGYLHIGSAKAIYINYKTAEKYGGKFNLRYDDTNPVKEDDEYVESIREDLEWLGAHPDGGVYYGSDYFDKCYEFAVKLIKDGKATNEENVNSIIASYRYIYYDLINTAKMLKERNANRVFICTTFGLFTNGFKSFDEYYEKGFIDLVITTNLNYRNPEIFEKPYYAEADMTKFLASIIDTLNHDISTGKVISPTDKIRKLLENR